MARQDALELPWWRSGGRRRYRCQSALTWPSRTRRADVPPSLPPRSSQCTSELAASRGRAQAPPTATQLQFYGEALAGARDSPTQPPSCYKASAALRPLRERSCLRPGAGTCAPRLQSSLAASSGHPAAMRQLAILLLLAAAASGAWTAPAAPSLIGAMPTLLLAAAWLQRPAECNASWKLHYCGAESGRLRAAKSGCHTRLALAAARARQGVAGGLDGHWTCWPCPAARRWKCTHPCA